MRDFKISRHWSLPGFVLTGNGWDFGHFASVQDAFDYITNWTPMGPNMSRSVKFSLTIV